MSETRSHSYENESQSQNPVKREHYPENGGTFIPAVGTKFTVCFPGLVLGHCLDKPPDSAENTQNVDQILFN